MARLWQDCTIAGVFGQKPAEFVANGRGKVETHCIPRSDSPDLGPTFDIHEGTDMKKVLLATTILGMTAGFAAADIAFKGSATAGFGSDNGGTWASYTSFKFGVAATAESDAGISFGASFSATSGTTFDFGGDDTERFDDEDGAFGGPTVFVSGDFGKVAFKVDGFDNYYDDGNLLLADRAGTVGEGAHDVEYSLSISDFSVGLRADIDSGESSLTLGYSAGPVALGVNFDDGDNWDASVEGTFDAITAGLSVDSDEVATLSLDYSANGVAFGLEVDTDDDYTLSAGYEANALAIGLEIDQDDAWEVTVDYDLGNGLAVESGMNSTDTAFVGATMSF
jgi:outer membrane protein OmpU